VSHFKIQTTDRTARAGVIHTPHGDIQTPFFMNVGTAATVKGGISAQDLRDVGCKVMLSNTYHLHIRPGDELIARLGGLRKFCGWHGPMLTDSGGFQVFSLAKTRKIREEGVYFSSHRDGAKIFMGPEESMQIQANLGATIAMAFDECVAAGASREYMVQSCAMTTRWLERCIAKLERLRQLPATIFPQQMLFGINQGGTFLDLRVEHMKRIADFDLPGYAVGGLAVGETAEQMYSVLDTVVPHMPYHKPRYLMGVGTPLNLLEAVRRGVDMFDCIMPSRNARHGSLFTWKGRMTINQEKYKDDPRPIDEDCPCPACTQFSRAYIRHLFKANELLGGRLCVLHNLHFYNHFMDTMREAIVAGEFDAFYNDYVDVLGVLL